MTSSDYLKDIKEIKHLMNKSSRFISLSGLSGIMAGMYALVGAWFARRELSMAYEIRNTSYTRDTSVLTETITFKLMTIAAIVLILAVVTGIVLTQRKARKNGERIFDKTAIKLLINFLIPLATGGIFTLILLQKGIVGLVAPTTLIFYGLACVNASKYTFGHVKYLGYANIILGLIATQYIGYGLYFWAIGFGVFHIIYGGLMYVLLERRAA
jgi:general stress protein CsbA